MMFPVLPVAQCVPINRECWATRWEAGGYATVLPRTGDTHEPFHGIVRIADNAGTEEQAFDIIATVKFHSQFYQFRDGKRGAREVVAAAVHAVGTIVDAIIGKHDFQQ